MDKIIERVTQTQHGFVDILKASKELFQTNELADCITIVDTLMLSDHHQVRMLATFLLGFCSVESESCFSKLRAEVSLDSDWRVQEVLAKAFDHYCAKKGYKASISVIKSWLDDENANVRRAVSEGLRIWTSRPYFKENPTVAIDLLSKLRCDDSDYVRKSVGNALRDISKRHPQLIEQQLSTWDVSDKKAAQVFKLANKHLEKHSTS